MTEAEHAALSCRLALAIGWDVGRVGKGIATVWCLEKRDGVGRAWRRFDYRDETVIWRVAERYKCFPFAIRGGGWWAWTPMQNGFGSGKRGDTAAEAVARAVVGAHE